MAELVAQGCSNREIVDALLISEGSARNILSVVLDKLDLRDRTQLAIFYWRRTLQAERCYGDGPAARFEEQLELSEPLTTDRNALG